MMKTAIVIPARRGSSRFPNKPLALVLGKQVLYRAWRIAKAVQSVSEIFIATDDDEIRKQAENFGAKVIMTGEEYLNGTERVFAATQKMENQPEIVINLQGDAILTPPWVVQAVVDLMQKDPSVGLATPATQLNWKGYDDYVQSKINNRTSGTLVVFDLQQKALYFSKSVIPHIRNRSTNVSPVFRHVGLYGYRLDTLKKVANLEPSPLEKAEMLEQLRALENGISIQVAIVDYRGRTHWSIDSAEDIEIAEEIIRREGELF